MPLPFNDARYSGRSAGAGDGERVGRGPESLRDDVAEEALRPGIAVARDGFVIDETFFSQTQQNLDYFDDVPSTSALYLDPDGTPRDVGTVLRHPDLARAYARSAIWAPRASTEARLQMRWSSRSTPARRAGGEPRLARGADDHA